MKTKRPFLIWLLSIIFLVNAFRYLLQVVQAIQSWNLLVALQYRLSPLYPTFQGTFLAGCFLVCAVLLFEKVAWAPTFAAVVTLLASLWAWVDRLALSVNPRPFTEQIYALIATIIFLGVVLGSLWSLQPYMKNPVADSHEVSAEFSSPGGVDES